VSDLHLTRLIREFLLHQMELPKLSVTDPTYATRMTDYAECVEILIAHKAFNGLYLEPLEQLICANPKLQALENEYDMAKRNSLSTNNRRVDR
jgi:hypothetical protein